VYLMILDEWSHMQASDEVFSRAFYKTTILKVRFLAHKLS